MGMCSCGGSVGRKRQAAVQARVVGERGVDADEDGGMARAQEVRHGFGGGAGEGGADARAEGEGGVEGGGEG